MKFSKLIIAVLSIVLFIGCGYKPSSHYAKERIQGKVFVDMYVSLEDPKNAVIIKDSMSEILVSRFGAELVHDKALADTIVFLRLQSVSMQTLQYDNVGYEKLYRANVSINVQYAGVKGEGNFNVTGKYDFSVDGDNEISEAKRFEAIRNASSKALEEVISKVAVDSFRKESSSDDRIQK